jgi:hypothetical protein
VSYGNEKRQKFVTIDRILIFTLQWLSSYLKQGHNRQEVLSHKMDDSLDIKTLTSFLPNNCEGLVDFRYTGIFNESGNQVLQR